VPWVTATARTLLPGLICRRRVGLAERERGRTWAVPAQQLQVGEGLAQIRDMAGRDPPEHQVVLVQLLKELPAPAHHVQVRAVAVDEVPQ
jgi:hypothetical protein